LDKIDGDALIFDDKHDYYFAVKIENIKSLHKYVWTPPNETEIADLIGRIVYFELNGYSDNVARLVGFSNNKLTFIQKDGIKVVVNVKDVSKLRKFKSHRFEEKYKDKAK
ncbi:MAG: hypothetical protein WB392_07275, partial [Methanotrichaceae archaeon]